MLLNSCLGFVYAQHRFALPLHAESLLGSGMLAFARGPAIFLVSAAVWTAGEIVNATNAEVYVANHTPMSHRGRFNAVLPVLGGLGLSLLGRGERSAAIRASAIDAASEPRQAATLPAADADY